MNEKKFTFHELRQHTDTEGKFYINLGPLDYNVVRTGGVMSDTAFPSVEEVDPQNVSMNAVFNNLHMSQNISISEMVESRGTRLNGLSVFVAKDDQGAVVANSFIYVGVVIWHV